MVLPTSIKMIAVRQQKESIDTAGLKIMEKPDKRSPTAKNKWKDHHLLGTLFFQQLKMALEVAMVSMESR